MKTYLEMLESIKKLTEAGATPSVMSDEEVALKKKLIAVLRNKDGIYGRYKHPKYAKRLKDFDLHIVYLDDDPDFTAAISFDTGTVYISEGFLYGGEVIFCQLNFLMRHELLHNLLMHQMRMMIKLNKSVETPWEHYQYSGSMHSILNIIEDFEISQKYSPEDKVLAVSLKKCGRTVHGLITEEHRDWMDLSIEQMYEEVLKEIESLHKDTEKAIAKIMAKKKRAAKFAKKDPNDPVYTSPDMLVGEMASAEAMYAANPDKPSLITCDLETFKTKKKYNQFPDIIKKLYDAVCAEYSKYDVNGPTPDEDKLVATAKAIENSQMHKSVKLDNGIVLYTPEEKWIVQQMIKVLLGNTKKPIKSKVKVSKDDTLSDEYVKMYNEIVALIDDADKYPTHELYGILGELMSKLGPTEEVNGADVLDLVK